SSVKYFTAPAWPLHNAAQLATFSGENKAQLNLLSPFPWDLPSTNHLYYDVYWATQHLVFVWLGCFTMYLVHCYPVNL
ncbi:unnamed protein product, partial [Timema podura]|nr:unnamed protein product [Timema podura]